eukprot:Skav202065  [mRNA]  locus=scaffold1138:619345:620132:+ [translate_table: standard]
MFSKFCAEISLPRAMSSMVLNQQSAKHSLTLGRCWSAEVILRIRDFSALMFFFQFTESGLGSPKSSAQRMAPQEKMSQALV